MSDYENMNEIERKFAEYLTTAPQEQRDHFRATMNTLMQCYGERPKLGLLATVIDKDGGTLTVTAINFNEEEMVLVAHSTLEVLLDRTAGVPADASVQ